MTDPRSRAAVEEAERFCDRQTTRKALTESQRAAATAYREARGTPARYPCWAASKASRPTNPIGGMLEALTVISGGANNQWDELLAVMIRDIFGPRLFRAVAVDQSWRTPDVVGISRKMYHDRDFSPMPILADALQDAGCDSDDVLEHCRGPGPHIRGCWAVDLLLGSPPFAPPPASVAAHAGSLIRKRRKRRSC